HAGKGAERERMFAQRARDNLACAAFCGLVGGQDELVFDGHSFVVDHTGQTIARAGQFREELLLCDVDLEWAASARLHEATHRAAERSARSSRGRLRVDVLPPLERPAPSATHFPSAGLAAPGAGAPAAPVGAVGAVGAKSPPLQPLLAPLEA